MTLNSSMVSLMDSARSYFNVDSKLSLSDLTNMFNPSSNIMNGTKDFTGDWVTFQGHNANGWKKLDKTFITNNSQNAVMYNGDGQAWNGLFKPIMLGAGNYVFSLYYYLDSFPDSDDAWLGIYAGEPNIDSSPYLSGQSRENIKPEVGKWSRLCLSFTVKKACTVACRLESNVKAVLYVSSYKLERNGLATPWIPEKKVNILDGVGVSPYFVPGGNKIINTFDNVSIYVVGPNHTTMFTIDPKYAGKKFTISYWAKSDTPGAGVHFEPWGSVGASEHTLNYDWRYFVDHCQFNTKDCDIFFWSLSDSYTAQISYINMTIDD